MTRNAPGACRPDLTNDQIDAFHTTGTSPSARVRTGRRGVVALPPRLPLEHGGVLQRGRVAYETFGDPDLPAVAVLGGISAGRHLATSDLDPASGWWEPFVGPGRAVDTTAYRAIGIDFLGGPGASSGPEDVQAAPGSTCAIGTRDQARALAKVMDYLGITRVHGLVGSSYGGMVGLAFAAEYPRRVNNLVCISAAHRTHPMATALRSVQRKIVRMGVSTGATREALSVARGLAMTTYRTAREFQGRFDVLPVNEGRSLRFPVDAYLDSRGERFVDTFTAEAFLGLSESVDLHYIEPAEILADTTLVAVESDTLVPPWQLEELAAGLGGPVELVRLESLFGHDAFLKEVRAVTGVVSRGLLGKAVAP